MSRRNIGVKTLPSRSKSSEALTEAPETSRGSVTTAVSRSVHLHVSHSTGL